MKWFYLITFLFLKFGSDIASKEYGLQDKILFWILAMVGYITATVFWLSSFKNGMSLSIGVPLTSIVLMIMAVGAGLVFYKEAFSLTQLLGIIFGITSVILLTIKT